MTPIRTALARPAVGRIITALAATAGALLASPAAPQTGPEGPFFYYHQGEQVELVPADELIAVRLRPGSEESSAAGYPALIDPDSERVLTLHGLRLLRLRSGFSPQAASDLRLDLAIHPDVELVARVFRTPSALMIVTDRFVARLEPGVDPGELAELLRGYDVEIVKRFDGDERTLLLRAGRGDGLAAANALHLLPSFAWAHPDFVRLRERPRPLQQGRSDEGLLIGPGGRRLSPRTPLAKGVRGYRGWLPGTVWLPPAGLPDAGGFGPSAGVTRPAIHTEGFEGAFPGVWTVSGSPTWATDGYRFFAGSSSGYCAGSSTAAPGPYPTNVDARMVYGPFNLADALDARLSVQAWIETEAGFDFLGIYASVDGASYYGRSFSGDWAAASGADGWMNIGFDLKDVYTLGDLRGQPQVWIMFRFSSDYSIGFEGVYLDEIVLEKITGGYEDLTSDVYDQLQWGLNNNGQLWGAVGADVRADEAWAVSMGADTVTIAILDEGVDLAHPDLAAKLVPGYDATGGGSAGAPSGDDAHGTACAGIAAAVTDNGLGVAGIAPLARIMPVRMAYGDGSGAWITSDAWIADGLSWAVANGADVLSNSYGGGSPSAIIDSAIANARANGRGGKGAVVVFAAGNDNGPVAYPATHPDSLAVAATSPCDERTAPTSCDGEYWWGSNHGAEVDLAAPGVHLYATDISGTAGYEPGDYVAGFNGTSGATPFVAGAAALLLGYRSDLTATQVETYLTTSADDLGPAGPDAFFGHGRLNLLEALLAIPAGTCHALTRTHTGSGADPLAVPANSPGCPAGSFYAGTPIDVQAAPSAGWSVSGWSGTDDDASTATSNTLTMPAAAHTVSVGYVNAPPTCYLLTRGHSGAGTDPVATPSSSAGCAGGRFLAGEPISLAAAPDPGWSVSGWSGTDADASTATGNSLTMPSAPHAVGVVYVEQLDPFRLSFMGADGNPAHRADEPDVAYNSVDDEYLVVWSGDEFDDEFEIYAQRVDAASGALVGGEIRVSAMGPAGNPSYGAYDPAVAYNPAANEFLVVWTGSHQTGSLAVGELEIWGQRLDRVGAPVGGLRRISDMGPDGVDYYDAYEPDVVYNGAVDEYLVVWRGDDDTGSLVAGEYEIYAQRVGASTGALLGGDRRISSQGSDGNGHYDAFGPAVACNQATGDYMVVWQGSLYARAAIFPCIGTEEWSEIYAQRLGPTANQIGGDFRISTMGPFGQGGVIRTYCGSCGGCRQGYRPDVTHNPHTGEYLAVWYGDDYNDTAGFEYEIFGQRLSALGAGVGVDDFVISDMGPPGDATYDATWPAVTYDRATHEYLVVWRGDDNRVPLVNQELEIFGQRLKSADATPLGANDFRLSAMGPDADTAYGADSPALAFSRRSHLAFAVWSGDDNQGSLVDDELEIHGRFLAFPGACGRPDVLELSGFTLAESRVVEACSRLVLGLDIAPPAEVTARAGTSIVMDEGLGVGSGCRLAVELDPSLALGSPP